MSTRADSDAQPRTLSEPSVAAAMTIKSKRTFWYAIVTITCIFLCIDIGVFISVAPQIQLFEDIVCEQYYSSTDGNSLRGVATPPNPMQCKAGAVQEAVAYLLGMATFFNAIPGVLLAIPYGALADKLGRRPILVMSLAGITIANAWVLFVCWTGLPLQMIWLSSAWTLIGGGSTVAVSVSMMIIADVATESQRSQLFFWIQGVVILAELIGLPIGAALLTFNPWIPLCVGFVQTCLATGMAMLIPETRLPVTADTNQTIDEHTPLIPAANHAEVEHESTSDQQALNNNSLSNPSVNPVSLLQHCFRALSVILLDVRLAGLVLTFFAVDFGRQSLIILTQYISERYSWTIGRASTLLALRAGFTLLSILFVFPAIDHVLQKKLGMTARRKDLFMAKVCILLTTTSFLMLAFAPSVWMVAAALVVYTLGAGFSTFARSLISTLVQPSMIGTLFTTLSMADTVGTLLAGPLIAEL